MRLPIMTVIIPVHNSSRPVDRAVNSITFNQPIEVLKNIEILVVCHEVSSESIREKLGTLNQVEIVKLLEFKDGVNSPSGPINFGIRSSLGRYILVIGSDDYLEQGFLTTYLKLLASKPHLDVVVLPKTRLQNGTYSYSHGPIPQFGLRRNLKPIRDRLLYRVAPLALVRSSLLGEPGAEFYTEGAATGGDLLPSTWLWSSTEKVYFNRSLPHYIECDDATDRVTYSGRPFSERLRILDDLLHRDWFRELSSEFKTSFAIKYLRTNILPFSKTKIALDTNVELRAAINLLFNFSALSLKPLSLEEKAQVRRILEANLAATSDESKPIPEKFKLSRIFPSSLTKAFSANSWFMIAIDITLGNFFNMKRIKHANSRFY